jgi:trigger factor
MTDAELNVSTRSPSQWGRVLSIEVPRARYDAVRANVMRDLRKRLVRPGFRAGHVPAAIVEREFAERIDSSTLEKFVPDVCGQAIEHTALDVISTPRVSNLELDDPAVIRLEVAFDVRPTIAVGELDGIRGTRWTLAITDDHVRRTLDDAREQHAQYMSVERGAQDGDFVQVNYVPLDASGREVAAKRVENYAFQIGDGNVAPEFEAAVRGRGPGETANAEVQYPADYGDAEVAGKTVAFILTIVAVKEKRLPAADDDFGRELGVQDLAELESRIRADLERRVREESERDLRDSLVQWLLQANRFEAPESMVEQFLEAAVADYDASWKRLGVQPQDEKRQEFERAARPAAERAVRRALVLESLAKQHGLLVTEEEVDRWIEDKVQASGPAASEVRAFFADVRRRRRLRGELSDDKVFEFLKGKAEISEVSRPAPGPDAA